MSDWEKWKTFSVAGVYSKNNKTDKMTRLDMISNTAGHGSKFILERELINEYDSNAIAVHQVFKSGGSVCLGYVPNNKKRGNQIADELAPLMDNGFELEIKFGRKFIKVFEDEHEITTKCTGLQLRYRILAERHKILAD